MQHCLITGGAGFIGSHLAERLVADGCRVRILDDFSSGLASNLDAIVDEVRVVEGKVQNRTRVRRALNGIDTVFHLAAIGSVPRSFESPLATHEANATGTLVMLDECAASDVERFVFASSSSVYGDHPQLPKKEGREGRALSPYAVSKRAGEDYCRVFHQSTSLSAAALRFFNVFGPRQRADHAYAAVIPRFIDASMNGRPIVVNGTGEQSRDFTYVSNNVDGIVAAARAFPDVGGQALNLAAGGQITLLELIDILEASLGRDLSVEFGPERRGDIRHSFADISALQEVSDYAPSVTVEDGVGFTVEWFANPSARAA